MLESRERPATRQITTEGAMTMALELGGLHHVTAVTARAADNVAFYTETLGMRLVKKTVNQDDVSAYHLFYADAVGNAGTDVTFFDWADTPPNRPGAGEIAATALRVRDRDALDWWLARFRDLGVSHGVIAERDGWATLPFTDPEGQRLELVADGGLGGTSPGVPWPGSPVPEERQIRGLGAVTLVVSRLAHTATVLTEVLGFRQVGQSTQVDGAEVTLFETGPGGPGARVRVVVQPGLSRARQGHGGVHHVAFRTPDPEQHQAWQERIAATGLGVTPVIDRFYFLSIYFREPGGILFEIATDGPGFATDEDPAHLGEQLALPPFLEPHRAEIEAGLRPLTTA
jgi:glyoxalase family protein